MLSAAAAATALPPPPRRSDLFDFAPDLSKKTFFQQTEWKKKFQKKKTWVWPKETKEDALIKNLSAWQKSRDLEFRIYMSTEMFWAIVSMSNDVKEPFQIVF